MSNTLTNKVNKFSNQINNIINKKGNVKPPKVNTNNSANVHITAGYKLNTNPFDYPITLGIVIILCVLFVSYAIYKHYSNDEGLKIGHSYYGLDISSYVPIFEMKTDTIEKCQNRCIKDPTCEGVTYNYDTKNCSGTDHGTLREEKKNFAAWIKPADAEEISAKSRMILSFADKAKYVRKDKIVPPGIQGDFCYSFYLTVYDFYHNFGTWRHIFHKGTPMKDLDATGYDNNYKDWENVVADYPDQCIGVWLAPYTNNIRICYSMISNINTRSNSHLHAFMQKCNSLTEDCYITDFPGGKKDSVNLIGDGEEVAEKLVKSVEFIDTDLQNIPINSPIHITINFRVNNVELYVNGKLRKITGLNGTPDFNPEDLYVMYPKSIKGQVSHLSYFPKSISQKKIMELNQNKPQYRS
jgi:hypothetical protein